MTAGRFEGNSYCSSKHPTLTKVSLIENESGFGITLWGITESPIRWHDSEIQGRFGVVYGTSFWKGSQVVL